ncbi:hypothetical protein LCGC14_1681560 [marine sediment metagenome]|uniref:Uncharacterized protein n=1 Tax=marine sediment metagenome TaxID=412755 RepID=A0A0F9IAW5_9ZZZZ
MLILNGIIRTDQPAEDQKTAFGELLNAELTPIVQIHSAYNINTRILEARDNNGSSSVANNMFKVSTGAAANQSSSLLSRIAVKYNAGQGGLWRGTGVFTTGAANSTQYLGIGTASEGYFVGYNGTAFGVMRRQGGSPEIRTLTISAGATTAENITITLDDDAEATVAVTNTGDTTKTANEIAAHDYSDVGQGWKAHSMGANVVFESYNAASQTGAYSLSGTAPVAGTFAQSVAGVAPTETIVAQTSWNTDKFDGSGASGITLDPTKGNVYQIRYQWLGFGLISFFIEDPDDGDYHLVHKIEYANANTIPSLDNPTLPVCMAVANTGNTTDIVLQSSSMMGAIEGKDLEEGIVNSLIAEDTGIGTDETPIFSIHNHTIYQSKINRVRIEFRTFTASIDSVTANKPSTIRVRLNPTLTGASFSAVDADTSVVRTDVAATAVSGGELIYGQIITEGAAPPIDFTKVMDKLNPGETITVSLESLSGNVDSVISMNWKELF